MDEDWVKKLLTIVIGSIVLFTVLICQTEQIEKNLVRETSGQKKEEQMVQKKKKEKNTQDTKEESQTILIKGEEENPTVRILIKSANYAGEYHQKVSICAEKGFILSYDGKEEEYKEELQEVPESDQEEENPAESEISYTEDYAQPAEEEAEPYEEAEVTSYETQPVEPVQEEATYEEPVQEEVGDINPYTGREYESNSVRMHPKRIGYVQVYDRANHKWTDMTEWAFLGYQERKKVLLGEDYEPPIYLD